MGLAELPPELLQLVAGFLDAEPSINALVRTSCKLHDALNSFLYKHNAKFFRSSALLWAARNGSEGTASKSIKMGGVVNVTTVREVTPLLVATNYSHKKVIELLLDNTGLNINHAGYGGYTALALAASKGDVGVLKILLKNKEVAVDLPDREGRTPLSWAASEGQVEASEILLKTGKVDPNLQDHDGRTPLSWAAMRGFTRIIDVLLKNKEVAVDLPDRKGRTPLSWAASSGQVEASEILLKTGKVDPNLQDHEGRTPLSWAVSKGNVGVLEILLKASEDTDGTLLPAALQQQLLRRGQADRPGVVAARRARHSCPGKAPRRRLL